MFGRNFCPCRKSFLANEERKFETQQEGMHFFKRETEFLGHIVSEKGIAMDPKKILSVADWLIPRTIKQVKSLTSFA